MAQELPKGLGTEEESRPAIFHMQIRGIIMFLMIYQYDSCMIVILNFRERVKQLRNCKAPKKSRQWIVEKKERRRKQGR